MIRSLSNEVRQEALNRENFNPSRADLQNIGNDLRTQFGKSVLAMKVLSKLTPDIEFVVFDGIRNPGEMEHLQIKIPGIVFVGTDAPIDLRKVWWIARAKDRKEDDPTEEGFLKAAARYRGIGESNSGQQVEECLRATHVHLINDRSGPEGKARLEQLYRIALMDTLGIDIEGLPKLNKERLR